MGCDVVKLYCEPNGQFPHNPEPLKEHLSEICELVVKEKADLGIVVDPDVDRLALVDENGELLEKNIHWLQLQITSLEIKRSSNF